MAPISIECPVDGCNWKSQELEPALATILNQQLTMHDKAAHSQPAPAQQPHHPYLKLKSPTISSGCTPDQWSVFSRQWVMYKTGMNIAAHLTSTALFYCCHEDLQADIMRDLQSDVATMPERELLAAIKRLAVKDESTLVHRITLSKMTQAPGTGIRTFLANLRGQAALCNYTATCKVENCDHTFDFSNEIIKDNLVRGIADPEILSDLLGDPKTDRSLEETVSFIAQKEQGKTTRSAVGDSTASININNRTTKPKHTSENTAKCWACGEAQHGRNNDRNSRARSCEAWSSTCSKCSIRGHYTSCCSKCSSCGTWGHRDKSSRWCDQNPRKKTKNTSKTYQTEDDSTSATYDQLCHIASAAGKPISGQLDHYIFDNEKWVARPSKPHPVMTVTLTLLPEDHSKLGHPMKKTSSLSPITIPMIADTGCQSTIIPLRSALAMGIDAKDIIPVKLSMKGAISEDLEVGGGIFAEVAIKDASGQERRSKQLVYVSKKIDKAFLCREGLISVGAIPANFPSVPASQGEAHIASMQTEDEQCSCPRRPSGPPPIPTSLPDGLSGSDEDVPALKQWLVDYYAGSAFNVCEHQPLPMMSSEPLELHVNPDAKPVACHKPALVPIHWQDKVLHDLERDVAIGVLEKVDPNTPVTWCSRMVVAAKADGSPRRTVDLQPLNRQSVRQTHHVPSPFHLADKIPQKTKKTVTDAWNGYHSIPLRKEDRHLTTFITPWGRYRYKVAPQGFLASGDAYNHRFDLIISDFPNKVKCVDDTCMWADSVEEAFFQTCRWLDLCARNGITLNPSKFQFAEDTAEFAGLNITPTNIKPSSKFLNSIQNFPEPTDITGARAWFGLVNQGAYAFAMAKQMKPFRHLLKPSNKFQWTKELDNAFQESKKAIVKEMEQGVRLFDPSRTTCLMTDWSVNGIGFFMMQKYCNCTARTPTCCKDGWRLCLVGSRFTHPAESRYAPVEGEALAVVYALHQTRYYILGCNDLIVATDHKPLLRILNDRSLAEIENRRLLNLKEKCLAYNFTIVHVPGAKNKGPDAASRYPPTKEQNDDIAEDDATIAAASDTLNSITNLVGWEAVKEATASDATLQQLITVIREGFPELPRDLPAPLRAYHRFSNSLCCADGVILMGQRIVIPAALRRNILSALHAAHQGVGAMSARAADSVFWPNLSADITRVREDCAHCHRIAKSNPMQPPSEPSQPDYPFQMLCSDYFTYNNHDYVVIVDRYTNWPAVYRSESGSEGLIKRLRETFVTFGVPEELTSDGGPQYTSGKTQEFLRSWGVRHRLTSVANPHANCRAEIAVKTVKRMLMDNTGSTGSLDVDKFQRAMLIYRNAIDPETKTSPAMILFGRPIRDHIPIPMGRYCPHSTWQETSAYREKALAKRHTREHEKWLEHTRMLPPLRIGDHVYLQNLVGNHPTRWERTGIVVEVRQHHQYVVKVSGSGRVTLRNRKHLRKFTPYKSPSADEIIRSSPPPITREESKSSPPTTPSTREKSPSARLPAQHRTAQRNIPQPPIQHSPSQFLTPSSSETPGIEIGASGESSPEDFQTPEVFRTPDPPKKIPRELRRLMPHNEPGINEETPPTGRRTRMHRSNH